jgi:predicted permease
MSRTLRRAGSLLVASQLAIALMLIASAGWMTASIIQLLNQPLGFSPDHLLVASTDLRGANTGLSADSSQVPSLLQRLIETVQTIPGVAEVAAANDKPLGGRTNQYTFCSDQDPAECKKPSTNEPDVFLVTPGYFRTVVQQMLRGRDFNNRDDGRSHVAIVSHLLAARLWPNQNPIGHRIYSGQLDDWATVVGEVEDTHSYSLEREPTSVLYLPEADVRDPKITILIRSHTDPTMLDEVARRTLSSIPSVRVRYVESMPELMGQQVAFRRFVRNVALSYSLLALGISMMGTYALIFYDVLARNREIGIRLALGSSKPGIVTLVLREELPWVVGGAACGLFGAAVIRQFLNAQLYHARQASAPVLLTSLGLLLTSAIIAIVVPAFRASQVDPAVTLRSN